MDANEISSRVNSRMNRIQKVSRYIRLFLLYGIPLYFVGSIIATFCIPKSWTATQLNSPDASAWIKAMNSTPWHLWTALSLVFFLFWYRTVLKLFGFFQKGILFTTETVRSMQILGGIYVAKFVVDSIFHFLIPDPLAFSLVSLSWAHLLAGLFIIFIAWLIDEARKIQEEQELTV
jgi:Protein of unknown function (DUF2975)